MDRIPQITVAIPTYNRAALLRETLQGVTTQNFPHEFFEILVIDNNSSDDTAGVVAQFSGARPAPRWIAETKQGLDYARNRAITEARGEIIIFADDDILVEPTWIATLTQPLREDSARRIGAVGGEVIPVFPQGLPPWVAEWHSPLGFRKDTGPLEARQIPMGANFAIPQWVFGALGEFHTGLDRTGKNLFGGGDAEFIRRIRAANLEVWFAPKAAVRHQMPASRTSFRYATRHAFDSARSRVVDRAGRPGAKLYLFTRFFVNVLKALGLALGAACAAIVFRTGDAKKALVRAWRCCGYLYQIPRSLLGRI